MRQKDTGYVFTSFKHCDHFADPEQMGLNINVFFILALVQYLLLVSWGTSCSYRLRQLL
jgi:hypothetical protein